VLASAGEVLWPRATANHHGGEDDEGADQGCHGTFAAAHGQGVVWRDGGIRGGVIPVDKQEEECGGSWWDYWSVVWWVCVEG